MSTLDDLRAARLFGSLPPEQIERLAAIARPRELPDGQSVFARGDAAEAFFLLAEGRVKVYKSFRDGRTATLRHVDPGETFGESVLFHETYPSSAETMGASRLLRFDTEEFLSVCVEYPEIAVNLLAAMARLLVLLNRRVEELLLPVPARLARYLLELADEQLDPATLSALAFSRHREVEGLSRKLARQDAAIAAFRRRHGLPEVDPEPDMAGLRAA